MSDRCPPVEVEVAGWRVITAHELLPDARRHAQLQEHFDDADPDDIGYLFTSIGRDTELLAGLVITQRFSPAQGGFSPGVLVVPETEVVFIGAGTRLLCYRHTADGWSRLWEDATTVGFWRWRRHGDIVVMSAEIQLAAWSLTGASKWTAWVEPPWEYEIVDGTVRLDVMGTVSSFPLDVGPTAR